MEEITSEKSRQKNFPDSRLKKRRTIGNTQLTSGNPVFQRVQMSDKLLTYTHVDVES